MDSFYFFTGITVLMGVIIYAIHCVNKTSYLYEPIRHPGLNRRKSETAYRTAAPRELTRSRSEANSYVDWYTHRNAATRNQYRQVEPTGTPYQVRSSRQERKEEPEVFVGMAFLHESSKAPANESKEKNIDRWFRQEAANG